MHFYNSSPNNGDKIKVEFESRGYTIKAEYTQHTGREYDAEFEVYDSDDIYYCSGSDVSQAWRLELEATIESFAISQYAEDADDAYWSREE